MNFPARPTHSSARVRTRSLLLLAGVVSEIMRIRISLGIHEETFPLLTRNMPALPRRFPASPHAHGFVQQEEGIIEILQ